MDYGTLHNNPVGFKTARVLPTAPRQPCARRMAGDCSRSPDGQTLVPLPPCVPASPAASRRCRAPQEGSLSPAEQCRPRRGTCCRSETRGRCRCAWSCCDGTVLPRSVFGGSLDVPCVQSAFLSALCNRHTQSHTQFLPARRYASAVLAAIVCLSVCLSQVGVLLRWLNLGSSKQRRTIAQGLYSFLMPKILAKFQRGHPQRGSQIEVG